jgi:GTP-binding protein
MSLKKQLNIRAKFLLSAASYKDFPHPIGAEYCILGRSNVGKSSFINHVLKNSSLARISKKPGKTNLANFYRINDTIIWVDLPGYGYARVSHKEKRRWSSLIRDYCEKRENLYGVIWLLDVRHVGIPTDVDACRWLCRLGLPVLPVITKSDKLTQSECIKHIREIEEYYHFNHSPVIYSIRKQSSRIQFWKEFIGWIESMR